MAIGIARWQGESPKIAIENVPPVFAERTGLSLDLKWPAPTRFQKPDAQTCLLSVIALRQRSFLSLGMEESSNHPDWNVEGEFDVPVHPYLWHHVQGCLAVVGLRAVRVNVGWQLSDQTVPPHWNHPW